MALQVTRVRTALRALWLLWLLAVIAGSLLPSNSPAIEALDWIHIGDKAEHAAIYALLIFLPALHERRGVILASAWGGVALGVALEFAQLLVPGRNFEIGDMIADAAGICLGMAGGAIARNALSRAGVPLAPASPVTQSHLELGPEMELQKEL
jgi:VanZ family protein